MDAPVFDRRPSISIHANRIGKARRTRQKAMATGPTSLIFTKIGAKAMPAAPASSAAKARPAGAAGPDLPSGPSSRKGAVPAVQSARGRVLIRPPPDSLLEDRSGTGTSSPPLTSRCRRRPEHEHDPSTDGHLLKYFRHCGRPLRPVWTSLPLPSIRGSGSQVFLILAVFLRVLAVTVLFAARP